MSNVSLGGNNGNSINFDGAALQSKEEDEYRKEEEQQQNELRALLTNAFDDLIDEDDILSITSEEGTDSRNVSLVRRPSTDSLNKLNGEENKIHEVPENDRDFSHPSASSTQVGMQFPPLPRFGQYEPLSRTQEFPRGQLDLLRASVESLPNFPLAHHRVDSDRHSNRDPDSDYHSSIDEKQKLDFHENVYPIERPQAKGHVSKKFKGQDEVFHKTKNGNEIDNSDRNNVKKTAERDNLLRKSIEDFQQLQEAYEQQQQEHYYGNHGNPTVHNQFQSAEQPYDQNTVQGHNMHDQGQFFHGHDPGQVHHGYDPHYHNHHQHNHHFRNIYENRPYHTIGEREETEGGNVKAREEYYQMHHGYGVPDHHGYYHNTMATPGQESKVPFGGEFSAAYTTTDHGFYSHNTGISDTHNVPNQTGVHSGPNQTAGQSVPKQTSGQRRLPPEPKRESAGGHTKEHKDKNRSKPNQNVKDTSRDKGQQQSLSKKEVTDNYKVNYRKSEEKREVQEEEKDTVDTNLEKDFMEQGGENQQLAQLQILYKARGRKIEELTSELEVVKSESARDMRILKHQLSVAKGEREGAGRSLESVQDLLQETKAEHAQMLGRVNASEAQIEGLKKGKDELIKKLQTAESTIETLHQHLEDLGSSDTLTRARHDHEMVVSGLQKKYDTEIKHLQEQVEGLNEKLQEKDKEVSILQQKLSDALKQSERDQISRADTINQLSQSLEESQKRCRNLLESTTSHDMSQMKVQLQQAFASKSISDEICSSLQDEIQDLKEQVQMYESASSLGISVTGHHPSQTAHHTTGGFTDQNDSMADLGIKKTLDYDTPTGTPTTNRTRSNNSSTSSDVVASLKSELERCLINNRQKRSEVTELKEVLNKVKKEMLEYKKRCEGAELQTQEHKKRIADLEFCLNPGDQMNAIENRLKKDIENLKREKQILLEDVEDLQKRLEEVSNSEEKITEMNRELSHQIAAMVKEYDQDKREAVDRTQRACDQVSETSRERLRQELTIQFDAERAEVIARYEKEVSKLSQELAATQEEMDKVKDVYVQLCTEKDNLHEQLEKEWTEKMEKHTQQVKQQMKKEEELAVLRAEEVWAKDKDTEVARVKSELEQALEKLREETASEMKTAQEKFENELKTIKDIMEIEKSNELEKVNKEKLNEIEKLKQSVKEKDKILDSIKTDKAGLVDMLKAELEAKILEIHSLKKTLNEKETERNTIKSESDNLVKRLKDDLNLKDSEINSLTKKISEMEKVIEKLNRDIGKVSGEQKANLDEKASEVEHLKQEMEQMLAKVESDRVQEVECLRKDIEAVYKEKDAMIEELRADVEKIQKEKGREVEGLKAEFERIQKEKAAEIERLKAEIEGLKAEIEGLKAVINGLKAENEGLQAENEGLQTEIERIQKARDTEIEKLQQDDAEKGEADNMRIDIVKNMQKEKQGELDQLKKEIIRLKLEIDRNEMDKQLEIDKVCRVKQAELENLEKRRRTELDRFKKEKKMEIDRLKKSKDDEINRLTKMRGERKDEEDITAKVRDKLNREMEEDLNRSLETKVAMSKVVWLEEHRATRQAAIDNAVRLAEAELKLKMEEDLEAKLEQRLEEAKILWQSDSMQQMEDDRHSYEHLRDGELAERIEKEHEKWRNTELQSELEAERQRWAQDLEQRLEEEKESWRELELETEKLRWTLDWEQKLKEEREGWYSNVLEPAKRKWKMEAEEKMRVEKDNWRCLELESEKLNLLQECEARIAKEKQAWKNRDLPAELEKEKKKWQSQAGEQIRKEQDKWRNQELPKEIQREKEKWRNQDLMKEIKRDREVWRTQELPKEIQKEREKWRGQELPKEIQKEIQREREKWRTQELPKEIQKERERWMREMEERLRQERNSWKNSDLPEEIEKERRKWMKLMETTLAKEKENWRNKDMPAQMERTKQELEKTLEIEVEAKLMGKLETEKEKLQKDSELKVLEAIEEHQAACKQELKAAIEKEKENLKEHYYKEVEEVIEKEKETLKQKYHEQVQEAIEKEKENLKQKYNEEIQEAIDLHQMTSKQELKDAIEKEKDNLNQKYNKEVEDAIEKETETLKQKYNEKVEEAIEKEKETLKQQYYEEVQERFQAEKKVWKEMVDQELNQKVEIEKEKWKRKSESDYNKKLEVEKEKMKSWIRKDLEKRTDEEKEYMKEDMERQFKNRFNEEISRIREKYDNEAREDFNHMKAKIEGDARQEFEQMKLEVEHEMKMKLEQEMKLELEQEIKLQLEQEMEMKLEKEKTLMQHREGRELSERIEAEKDKWKSEFEKELSQRVHAEEEKWKQMIENDIEKRLAEERETWETRKESDWENRLAEERKKWLQISEEQKVEEMKILTEQFEDRMRSDMEEEMDRLKIQVEQEFHQRVEHEVDCAVQEAHDDWIREYTMEKSINTTSAEASQGLLREEIENLKHRVESLQSELRQKEEAWLKEKEDLLLQKDLAWRREMDKLQEQNEAEYQTFITDHQETLNKALKASREQHTKDKQELEERYLSQIKLIQAREKALQSQLHESLEGTQEQSSTLAEFEKERIIWFEERDRLLQDISDRETLLGKADVHLSKEIDKLRTELQSAYQRRLETEVTSFKQKLETEFNRANNSEHKEKLQLEKQLSEVNTELNKLRTVQVEEKNRWMEELKKLNTKTNDMEKRLEDYSRMEIEMRSLQEKVKGQERQIEECSRLEGELRKAKELLKGYTDELAEMQEKCSKMQREAEELQNKLTKAVQNQEMLQEELKKMRDEKGSLIESVQSIEASYRKDVAVYKQRQDEANTRILRTEKILQDMKQKYRSELESLRKALEVENDVAMNAMKNKMIELQKKHLALVEEIKKKHMVDREQLMKGGAVRGITPQPNTTDVDEIDQAVKELRSQYLDTVHKIKGDVLRHITETNVRAAETVKQEMDRERVSTFNQIKTFYRHNVKQILETEVVGSNLETKLRSVEEALDNLSSNPSSRSATPEDFVDDERSYKSRSLSNTRDTFNRDAGISPKSQRSVSFVQGTRDDRSKTPISSKDTSYTGKSENKYDDPRSPKSRLGARSPREATITMRGEVNDSPKLRSTRDWVYDTGKDGNFDTRAADNRPVSSKTHREMRDSESRPTDRPLSAKSPRDLHISLREKSGRVENKEDYADRERNGSGDKKKSRLLISTKDIHSGRYTRPGDEEVTIARAKSVTSVFANHSSLYRPTSVPDLYSEDKELKVWTESNNDTYRYTPLRETLKSGSNLHRSNSKSESDLSIAEKNFGQLKPDYDSNLDLSTGSLTSIDSFFTPRKRDAGETPTSTPRRHGPRKHYTMHSFPTGEQLTKDLMSRSQILSKSNDVNVSSPISSRSVQSSRERAQISHERSQSALERVQSTHERSHSALERVQSSHERPQSSLDRVQNSHERSQSSGERKNLPLIQFRHGKMQNLARVVSGNSKSPHPDEPAFQRDTPPTRDTSSTPERHYRPLSVSSNLRLDF